MTEVSWDQEGLCFASSRIWFSYIRPTAPKTTADQKAFFLTFRTPESRGFATSGHPPAGCFLSSAFLMPSAQPTLVAARFLVDFFFDVAMRCAPIDAGMMDAVSHRGSWLSGR